MKRLVGILLAVLLVATYAAALATGTYAVGTDSELLSGDHTAQIIESLKKNGSLEKIAGQKTAQAGRSDALYYVGEDKIKSPDVVCGTSVNNRVSLTWQDSNKKVTLWSVYEKINGEWKYLDAVMRKNYSINNVSDG